MISYHYRRYLVLYDITVHTLPVLPVLPALPVRALSDSHAIASTLVCNTHYSAHYQA